MIQYLVFVGVAAQVAGTIYYAYLTIIGKVKPNRVTWLFWAISPLIGATAAFVSGARWSILPVFIAGVDPFLVFVASFLNPQAYWKLQKTDYICALMASLALISWKLTDNPTIAIVFSVLGDFAAGIPTFIKAYKYPKTESVTPYYTCLFSVLISLLAIQTWNFNSCAFSVYLLLANLVLIIFIKRKQKN